MIWNRILYYGCTRIYMSYFRTTVELSIFVDLGNYCLGNNPCFFCPHFLFKLSELVDSFDDSEELYC